jgi:LacI family transcriptional regulator
MMKSLLEEVSKKGFSLLVFQSDDSYEKELELIDYYNQLSVDGIMISIGSGHSEDLLTLNKDGAPLVLLDKVWGNEEISSGGIDGSLVITRTVDYLEKKGHKKIGGIFSIKSQMITQGRLLGYNNACIKNKIDGNILRINIFVDFDRDFLEFLKQSEGITANYAMTDELMIRCHSGLVRNGYILPSDISLIAISDGVLPDLLTPHVTHFYHSPGEIGKTVGLLFYKIKDKNTKTQSLNIDCNLVELESVRELK